MNTDYIIKSIDQRGKFKIGIWSQPHLPGLRFSVEFFLSFRRGDKILEQLDSIIGCGKVYLYETLGIFKVGPRDVWKFREFLKKQSLIEKEKQFKIWSEAVDVYAERLKARGEEKKLLSVKLLELKKKLDWMTKS